MIYTHAYAFTQDNIRRCMRVYDLSNNFMRTFCLIEGYSCIVGIWDRIILRYPLLFLRGD